MLQNIIDGDRYEFEEHCYWTECPSNAVMCWILCRTWTAEESDVVEFCNTLVCRPNREPSLHPQELINLTNHRPVRFDCSGVGSYQIEVRGVYIRA